MGFAFSPDSQMMSTCSSTGFGYLWDTENWTSIATLRHNQAITGICFSPDSKRVITSGVGREAIKLWDTANHREVLTLAAGNLFSSPALLKDGRTLVAVGRLNANPLFHIWRAPTFEEIEAAEAEKARRAKPRR